jgi:hypothetical protein
VLIRSEDKVEFQSDDLNKMMRCSKYQLNEMVKNRHISDWEKCTVMMDLNKDQREKMRELKIFAQKSRKAYTK